MSKYGGMGVWNAESLCLSLRLSAEALREGGRSIEEDESDAAIPGEAVAAKFEERRRKLKSL